MARGAGVNLREEFERIGAEAMLLPLSTLPMGTIEEQEGQTCLGEEEGTHINTITSN